MKTKFATDLEKMPKIWELITKIGTKPKMKSAQNQQMVRLSYEFQSDWSNNNHNCMLEIFKCHLWMFGEKNGNTFTFIGYLFELFAWHSNMNDTNLYSLDIKKSFALYTIAVFNWRWNICCSWENSLKHTKAKKKTVKVWYSEKERETEWKRENESYNWGQTYMSVPVHCPIT